MLGGDKRRALSNAFIVLVLGYEIGMPLTYYLSDRVYDERFSWRMFSSVRLQECAVKVSETLASGERPVAVAQDLQVAWVNVLERLRPAVIEKYLVRRCDAGAGEAVSQVALVGTCQDTEGKRLPAQHFTMACAKREMQRTLGEEPAP